MSSRHIAASATLLAFTPSVACASGDTLISWLLLWYMVVAAALLLFVVMGWLGWRRKVAAVAGTVTAVVLSDTALVLTDANGPLVMSLLTLAPIVGFALGLVASRARVAA